MGISGAVGISVALWWLSSSSPFKASQGHLWGCCTTPKQRGNNTEQNTALLKLLQALQMPVHISVLLGSTQGETRLVGACQGTSSASPPLSQPTGKSLRTQGCPAGCAAGCQKKEEGAWVYFYVTWGKERQDRLCFVLCFRSLDAQSFSSSS